MKIETQNLNGDKSSIDVNDKIFTTKLNKTVISNVLYKQVANIKGRRAKTKQKNEIIGSTSKIYAQKGTGNARHASRKAPIFVGGGVAHGPKGQKSYKIRKLTKSEKKLSVKSLISEKNNQKKLLVLSDFEKEIKKTKEMYKILKKLDATNSLIVTDKKSLDFIYKSTKNIPNIKITDANHFSSYDLVKYEKLVLTISSIKDLEKRLI
tara:strand:+ start:372 stop:995 length:624 start_codon:yes stop_codon:yes gene_type:complete